MKLAGVTGVASFIVASGSGTAFASPSQHALRTQSASLAVRLAESSATLEAAQHAAAEARAASLAAWATVDAAGQRAAAAAAKLEVAKAVEAAGEAEVAAEAEAQAVGWRVFRISSNRYFGCGHDSQHPDAAPESPTSIRATPSVPPGPLPRPTHVLRCSS